MIPAELKCYELVNMHLLKNVCVHAFPLPSHHCLFGIWGDADRKKLFQFIGPQDQSSGTQGSGPDETTLDLTKNAKKR